MLKQCYDDKLIFIGIKFKTYGYTNKKLWTLIWILLSSYC